MWLARYQHWDKKSFVPFSDFYKKPMRTAKPDVQKSKEEIIRDTEMILDSLRRSQAKGG